MISYNDSALAFENCVNEALFMDRCARGFARRAHGLEAAKEVVGAAKERHRAHVYRGKAKKRLNAARQHLPN